MNPSEEQTGRNMATEIFTALHGSTPIYIRDLFEERIKFIIYVQLYL